MYRPSMFYHFIRLADGRSRHERAGEHLSFWAASKMSSGDSSFRVKSGIFGVVDTKYTPEAYAAADQILEENRHINIVVNRFEEKVSLPSKLTFGLIKAERMKEAHTRLYDVMSTVGDESEVPKTDSSSSEHSHVGQIYP